MASEVPPDSPAAEIIAEEERIHARVSARVAVGNRREGTRLGVADVDEQLIGLRDAIAEAKPEDLAPLVEEMTRLVGVRSKLGGSLSLPVDVDSPYFAHMALREDGRRRDVLVGKRGFIDRESDVQIVDWRNAPISRVYYRYEEGDDYQEEIAGRRVEGLVEVRRNLSILGGRLRRIGAPQGTFVRDAHGVWHQAVGDAAPRLHGGQGKAARAPRARPVDSRRGKKRGLGVHHGAVHRADKHMPEIAALIDREQFDLITQPEGGLVLIEGGAGSGKTTVALHRIAYLGFADGSRFRPKKILFVVPTEALVHYVAHVLPALGVRGVPVSTYAGWAKKQRLRLIEGSSGKYNDDTPDAVARVKKHPAMLVVLDDYVAEEVRACGDALRTALEGMDGRDAVLAYWRASASVALVPRLRSLLRWARQNAELPALVRRVVDSHGKRLLGRANELVEDWAEVLTDRARLERGFAAWDGVDAADLAATVRWCSRQQEGEAEPVTGVDGEPIAAVDGRSLAEGDPRGRFDVEDDPILLRLAQLKRGGLFARGGKQTLYEHVAIDEAQDRSAIEIKVLLEATAAPGGDPAKRSVTIAGDPAQRLVFDNSFTGWRDLLAHTGYSAAVVRPLSISYRSTAEVMQLARDILGPDLAPKEDLVARSGAPVELHEFGDVGESVAFLADALRALMTHEPTASVAVIARYPEQADAYWRGLARAEIPALRRVRQHDFSFEPGVDVTDASQVKGLEFDYVVMVDANASSYPDAVEARHLMHIGVTRAAHQLWLLSTAAPSRLLPDWLRH